MDIKDMFRYKCTICREHSVPGLKLFAKARLYLQGFAIRRRLRCWCQWCKEGILVKKNLWWTPL